MGILQRYLDSIKAKKTKYSEAEEDMKIGHRIQEKQKNANEREYERYMEEARQKQIEKELNKFRAEKQNEIWHKNVISGDKNIFNGKCMFANKSNGSLLKWR